MAPTHVRSLPRLAPIAALALALGSTPGCFATTGDVQTLTTRINEVEQADAQRKRELTEATERARQEIRTLTEQLEQARAQTRNLADIGARMGEFEQQLRALAGAVAEVRHTLDAIANEQNTQRSGLVANVTNQISGVERRIGEIERRVGIAPAVDPSQIPTAPADIMTQARAAMTARDYNRARALASALLERAPQDALADDARLLLGRAFAAEGRHATAAQEFNRLITDFPSADTVPEAMTDMVEAFVRLGLCTSAQRTLRLLIERYGSTPQGAAARRRLDEVRRLPRAACTG